MQSWRCSPGEEAAQGAGDSRIPLALRGPGQRSSDLGSREGARGSASWEGAVRARCDSGPVVWV